MYLIENLSIGYKNKPILNETISFEFPSTGIFYLYGINGSGKTTFIKTITGNLKKILSLVLGFIYMQYVILSVLILLIVITTIYDRNKSLKILDNMKKTSGKI